MTMFSQPIYLRFFLVWFCFLSFLTPKLNADQPVHCNHAFGNALTFEYEPLDSSKARKIFLKYENRIPTTQELEALEQLHQIGSGEEGLIQGTDPEPGNYTDSQIIRKYRGARQLGLKESTSRALLHESVLGSKKRKKPKNKTAAEKRRRQLKQKKNHHQQI